MLSLQAIALSLSSLTLLAPHASAPARPTADVHSALDDKARAQAEQLIRVVETKDHAAARAINPHRFIQHNLTMADGLAGFGDHIAALPAGVCRAHVARLFVDGPFVVAHTDYALPEPTAGFDIFRFEQGQIVEHWDNLQPLQPPNPSGHTQTDGTAIDTAAARGPLGATKIHKKRAQAFVQSVLIEGRTKDMAAYFDGNRLTQHSSQVADGVAAYRRSLLEAKQSKEGRKVQKIHRVLGEGAWVLVVSEGRVGRDEAAFYDLFRLESGRIVEHWDTTELLPAVSLHKNRNGKF